MRYTTRAVAPIRILSSNMSKITESAKGEECQVRIPGVCNFDDSTTIPAHLNGGGVALKVNDIHIAYCCSACHDVLDGRVKTQYSNDQVLLWFYEAVFRTQMLLLAKGLISTGENHGRKRKKGMG